MMTKSRTARWLGLCSAALVLMSPVLPAFADAYTASRTTGYTYIASGPQAGFLATETVEPDDPSLCSTKGFAYDAFGNKNQITTGNCAQAPAAVQFATRLDALQFNAQTAVAGGVSLAVAAGSFPTIYTNTLGHAVNVLYDPRFGSVLDSTDANGLTTHWTVDDLGRPSRMRAPDGTSTVVAYCSLSDAGVDTADASNSSVAAGDPIACPAPSTSEAPVGAASFSHREVWDSTGRKMGSFVRIYWDRLGRPLRRITENFDGPQQANANELIAVDQVYDAMGSLTIATQPYFLTSRSSTTSGAGDVGLRRVDHDLLWRPIKVYRSDPAGGTDGVAFGDFGTRKAAVDTYAYAALKITITNDKGQVQVDERTVIGQSLRVTDPSGAQLLHQRDAFGNLVATKDALQNVVQMSYDRLGRKLSLSDPDGGQVSYRYDAIGELVWQQNALQLARGSSTSMAYDALGRLISRAESAEYQSSWTYDRYADQSSCLKGIGKLCESRTSNGLARKYAYDAIGRPVSGLMSVLNGPSFGHSVTYDAVTGQVASVTYPTGLQVAYRYTSGRRQLQQLLLATQANVTPLPSTPGGAAGAAVQLPANAVLWSASSENAWGAIESQTYGNGVVEREVVDPGTGRLLERSAGSSSGKEVLNQRYAWDSLGHMTGREEINADGSYGLVENFEYGDGADPTRNVSRLTKYAVFGASIPDLSRTVTLKYNALGMLLQKSDVGDFSYGAQGPGEVQPHALRFVDGVSGSMTYVRDVNGNVTSGDQSKFRSIAYNSFNLPDSQQGIVGPNGASRYVWQYDENYGRVKEARTDSSGLRTTWYVHPDNAGALSFESEESSGQVSNRHFLTAGGQTVGVVITQGSIPAVVNGALAPAANANMQVVKLEYWHKSHQGSVATTTDHVGAVTGRYSYDPFGKRRFVDGNVDPTNSLVVNWGVAVNTGTRRGFTGHEHLDELGLIHMNGRLFDPATAQFMQADPLVSDPSDLQSYHRYAYCRNNPLTCTDPSGFRDDDSDAPRAYEQQESGDSSGGAGVGSGRTIGSLPGTSAGVIAVIPGRGVFYGSSVYVDANGCTYVMNGQQLAGPGAVAPRDAIVVDGVSFKDHLSQAPTGQPGQPLGSGIPSVNAGSGGPRAANQTVAQPSGHLLNGGRGEEPSFKHWAKNALTVSSFIPGLQTVSGLGSAAWDIVDGDYISAGLSLATMVPVLGEGAAAARLARLLRAEGTAVERVVNAAAHCACCFVGSTPVLTAEGNVPIEKIEIGTLVQSRDPETGATALKAVTEVIRTEGRALYGLTFLQQNGGATRVESSDNHPFWVEGTGWVDSADLKRGMKVPTFDGRLLTVVNVEPLGRTEPTYNLTVADFHTFFAGEAWAYVHNMCACSVAAKGLAKPGAHSVVFETTIAKTGAGTRDAHKALANRDLAAAMSDKEFAGMLSSMNVKPIGGSGTPGGFRWHHAPDRPGVMQLVPEVQHTSGSIFQDVLHPGGSGGFAQWGRGW
ncbi:polymorphic toxin-type HINT domain-containing protein [Roseateles sp. L2-2]|uniref:polymorphic toxin-type HINT domain-containing protein n=1 Tax=Roseateles TaxID=93681 RepID=UPI003D35F63D